MIVDDNLPKLDLSMQFLRRMRNDIIGSEENKLEYIKYGHLKNLINNYIATIENAFDKEHLKLLISIINSFIITHPIDVKNSLNNYSFLTQMTIKLIFAIDIKEIILHELLFKFLKSLSIQNLFSVENCFSSGLITKLDEYFLNDVCYLNICIILKKICESSYYKYTIYRNHKLTEKLIRKFFESKNQKLIKYLLEVITNLSEEELNISKQIYELGILELIPNYIRYQEIHIKIYSINLLVNVMSNLKLNFSENPIIIWSFSILLDIIKENSTTKEKKIRTVNTLSIMNKKGMEMETIFYNLDGIEIMLRELRSLYTDDKLKEIEEYYKGVKSNKKKNDKMETDIIFNEEEMDEVSQYRRAILECLSQASNNKEESRKKIIDSKELCLILHSLNDHYYKILISDLNLILSLSRAQKATKNLIIDYDIIDTLFKLSNHHNIDIQIASTNPLCNFLLETNPNEVTDYINKLFKILNNNKHSKIRYNSICAIKNIIYNLNSNREIKKSIMKKITYETLLTLIDDEEILIQEQVLLIFRALVYRTSEDIEEVFTNCKTKLLKKVEDKLDLNNNDIILQALYILCNISAGNDKHKSVILEKNIMKKVVHYIDSSEARIRLVSILILNNLLSNDVGVEKRFYQINDYNLLPKLEKIINKENEDNELKTYTATIINQIKILQK